MHTIAYVGLGSNLGQREALVLRAARELEARRAARVRRLSSLYLSDPVDIADARRFVNAVAEVETLLPPVDLLERLKAIEAVMGRTSGHRQSREIDLDLVSYGRELVTSERLVVPHPRFHLRAFVLIPLREIAPGFTCPRTERTVDQLLAALPGDGGVERISGRDFVGRG